MKKTSFLFIIALIFVISTKAQRPDRPNFDLKEMVLKMVTDLNDQVKLQPAIQDSIKGTSKI